jgi:hypothetical protein
MQKRLTAAPRATLTDCCSAADSVKIPIGRTWERSALDGRLPDPMSVRHHRAVFAAELRSCAASWVTSMTSNGRSD